MLYLYQHAFTSTRQRVASTEIMTRGAFIVVEGLDRSGKSTQTAALCDRIASLGKSVKLYKFPGEHIGLECDIAFTSLNVLNVNFFAGS
jgi:adenylylsulfate kinase-like enzyme